MKCFHAVLSAFLISSIFSFNCRGSELQIDVVQANLDERVKRDLNHGIVVGVMSFQGSQFHTAGTFSPEDARPVDQNTLFELGSVSKIFTASAAAALISEKKFSWRSKVNPYLPKQADPPTWKGQSIMLHDLATHTAALPELPLNLKPKSQTNPYTGYTADDLYLALSKARLPYTPGKQYRYSHYGYALLGHVLELGTRQSYADILKSKITQPLRLRDTGILLSPQQQRRLAPAHLGQTIVPHWEMDSMAPSEGLRSTAKDLLQFVGTHIGLNKSKLARSFKTLQTSFLPTTIENTSIGYGWHITQAESETLYWLSGTTGGHACFVGFNLIRSRCVVVLTNTTQSIDDIGFHVLAPKHYALKTFPKILRLPAKTLKKLTGKYTLAPEVFIEITNKGGRLYAEVTGQPKFRVYPSGPRTFLYADSPRVLNFETNKKGQTRSITITEGLKKYSAKRISSQ